MATKSAKKKPQRKSKSKGGKKYGILIHEKRGSRRAGLRPRPEGPANREAQRHQCDGDFVARASEGEEVVGEIDLSEVYGVRDYIPYLKDRKPTLHGELTRSMDG